MQIINMLQHAAAQLLEASQRCEDWNRLVSWAMYVSWATLRKDTAQSM